MRFVAIVFTALFLPLTGSVLTLPEIGEWIEDFQAGQELALKKDCPLLIAFLGPDWCSSSDRLEQIITDKNFLSSLEKECLFIRVTIPENADLEAFPGHLLREKYNVTTCPALILVKPTGEKIADLPIATQNGREYALTIKEVIADFSKVKKFSTKKKLKTLKSEEIKSLYVKAGQFADKTFKKAFFEEGLKTDTTSYFLLEQYGQLLSQEGVKARNLRHLKNKILSNDPKNQYGYRRQIAVMDFEALAKITSMKNAQSAIKPLLDYLHEYGTSDPQHAWKLEMKISQYLFSHDQKQEALKHARASLKLAPEGAQKEVAESIAYLEQVQ